MNLSNNQISFKAAVNLHAAFWENNMKPSVNNFQEHMNFVVFDIAHNYRLSLTDASILIKTLYIKSDEDLDSRFLGYESEYNIHGGKEFLENDLFNTYGYVVPYDIVCGLIVARKPLERL